ncbi:MAG TPA: acyltransferase [Actinomycetota bacterium]|nr:acyltransferase [Actinomycetota bacterium]
MRDLARQLRAYYKKSRFLNPNAMPWTRAHLKWLLMRREAYVVWPLYGHVLPALQKGQLELGPHVSMQAGCWLNIGSADARIRIGRNVYLNGNLMIASYGLVEIGDFSAIGRGALIMNATHRTNDPTLPIMQQGMVVEGPTIIGRNVWIGNNAAIIGAVRIGDRAVVAANSVVTRDVEPGTVVAGIPARATKHVETITPVERP